MSVGFVHLRLHTEYSLTDGIIRLERPEAKQDDPKQRHLEERFKTLTEQAAELKFPAVAVTDLGNLYAMVKFYKAAEGAAIKPLIGADLRLEERAAGEGPDLITLLVQNETGYRNLVKLVSRSYTEGQARGLPQLQRDWLSGHTEGLLVLCGPRSDLGRALLGEHFDIAQRRLDEWRKRFGDRLYLEVQRCGRPDDEPHLRAAVRLARHTGTPLVASNDVRFLHREDFEAHEARVCIAQGYTLDDSRRPRDTTAEQYLKSSAEMRKLFADLPEALANTVEIARRCTLTLKFGQSHLPDFPVPAGHTAATYLREQAQQGLEQRLQSHPPVKPADDYRKRLVYELDVIEQMGFAGYFLVVADFIAWAKTHGVPVGPGRGSGAGSLVAYATGITDLDPIPYDLLFERFLNPERVSLPDFDIDFCMDGRDRVIDYVMNRYGRDRVGQIITYGTMAARAVVRDVARILGHPYGLGDRLAKMIPGGPQGLSLGEALDEVPELKAAYKNEDDIASVVDLGLQLEGLTRNVGKHAGGVVIAPRALTEFTPLFCEPGGGGLVTQFDMKDLEAIGLIKFDFLGLKTLTIIQSAVDLINAKKAVDDPKLDILKIPLDDPQTYLLYATGNTSAVFQMESGGMQRASVDLKPDHFEDIIALISLFRPGPMELIPDFVARKHGRQSIAYLHPEMETLLKPTLGIIVYQEQVMQIAQRMAGFTLGAADLLRRAMGKKDDALMSQQRDVFIKGAIAHRIHPETAGWIFDLIHKFAGYGFNKSHAAAYALVSYQTAWLKTHYPADYMAAVLSCDMDKTDTVVMMIDECRRMGLSLLPPDINRSGFRFKVTGENPPNPVSAQGSLGGGFSPSPVPAGVRGGGVTLSHSTDSPLTLPRAGEGRLERPLAAGSSLGEILYGLGAIKGAGAAALAGLLEEREKNGPFRDLFDLCRRADLRKTNKRVLEALAGAGALDSLGANRPSLLKTLPKAMAMAEQSSSSSGAGQSDMFGLASVAPGGATLMEQEAEWPELERLRIEKETLGFYFSGHPIEMYRPLLEQICHGSLKSLIEGRGGSATLLGGWVIELRRIGKRLLLTLDDRSAQVTCILGEELLGQRAPPRKDTLLFVQGRLSPDEFTGGWKVFPNELYDLEQVQSRYAERVLLKFVSIDTARDAHNVARTSRIEANASRGLIRGNSADFETLMKVLLPLRDPKGCPVTVHYANGTAKATLDLGDEWRIRIQESGLEPLKRLLGEQNLRVIYRRPAPSLAEA